MIKLSKLGFRMDARPSVMASAGVRGGPGVYGVLSFEPDADAVMGVERAVVGEVEVAGGRDRDRARCFGFVRFMCSVAGKVGGDDVGMAGEAVLLLSSGTTSSIPNNLVWSDDEDDISTALWMETGLRRVDPKGTPGTPGCVIFWKRTRLAGL